jgi:hypothetical protein
LFSSQDAAPLTDVAFCWDEASVGFHDIRHHASNKYIENSADEKKKIHLVIKSFTAMIGDGVKCSG